jgi:haloalkane dehalogenase
LHSSAGLVHYLDEGEGRVALDYPGFGLSTRPPGYRYTAEEHAGITGELIESLDLGNLIVMGQDWGGPIGMAAAVAHADRVSGLVFGNTWFWPSDERAARAFSWIMGSRPLQWAILRRNLFVERFVPAGCATKLSPRVMDHYRGVQPDRTSRAGVAELPRQITDANPWLAELAANVPGALGNRRALFVWGDRDRAFPPGRYLPRWESTFPDHVTVHLPEAKHFIQEDAPAEIADAIAQRFAN